MGSNPFLGFLLLTHEKPRQILRLMNRLNIMFDDPPIVCHHDFSQCELPGDEIPENVSLVRPYLKTSWGDWLLAEATVKGIELLYRRKNKPEWFILLSGTDYPVKPAEHIINDLKNSPFDVHMSILKLLKSERNSETEKKAFTRYHTLRFKYPSFIHLLQSLRTMQWSTEDIYLKKKIYTRWLIPFSVDFNCYYGSQWFCANNKAAEYILEFHKTHPRLRAYYKNVHAPDESYFHTILGNSSHLKISGKNRRYIKWLPDSSHPKSLSVEDIPKFEESEAHFARKFDMEKNPDVLDRLDELCQIKVHAVQSG